MKRPEGTGTARNDESPPCRNRYVGDCACEHLIWDHGKRLSWCLAGGPSAEAWSVSRRQDCRRAAGPRGLPCHFLGISWYPRERRGANDGKIGPFGQTRAHSVSNGDEDGEREYWDGTGNRLAAIRSLTKSQLASLCFLFSDHQGDRGAGQSCELLDCTAGAGIDQSQQPDLNREVLAL